VALCLVAGVFVAAAFNSPSPADGAATGLTWDATPASATGDGAASPSAADLVVHVAGAVMAAGVYELSAGARVVDAIEAAGGAVEGADLSAINLAAVLADGERVYVPLPGETPPAVVSPGGLGVSGIGADGRVNVNTADAAELETLPGVGAVLAGRIIDFRTANGPFQQLGDLGEVSGIGPKILAGLAEAVTFG
jgi:competence protein ComEA